MAAAATPPPPPRVTLVSRGRFTPYSGMLPGWAAGHYSYSDCHVDLRRLVSYAEADLVEAEATGLDATGRRVLFGDGSPPIPYDALSVDIGITPGRAAVPGAEGCAAVTPVKPIDGSAAVAAGAGGPTEEAAAPALSASTAAAAAAAPTSGASPGAVESGKSTSAGPVSEPLLRVVVVGGGAGGVELAAAVQYRLEAERRAGSWTGPAGRAAVSLVCRGGLLPGHPPHVRRLVGRLLSERGVHVRAGDEAVSVVPGELLLRSGDRLPYDECLWCTAATPAAWLRRSGLPTDSGGFLAINEYLQSDGGPQEGPPLASNLRAFLEGRPLQPFVPQHTALALISLGDRFCIASRTGAPGTTANATRRRDRDGSSSSGATGSMEGDGPEWPLGWLLNGCGGAAVALTGPLLWLWKDAIDRAFMRRYGDGLGDVR
ncbi:hypothetical protein GPECTOR_51g703 [Gonium pectorale]|uniref:FAD/NAD(P)-binding domain-containing protein n=1 Tax=Gonium pectorale TaxID=33097 RepID=A0A150G796_GONPE|nr:hypothetical protein GPECTOR_51g703 [Gonium pectorale]|eukprot:KXZ45717.1 hypothetical protein GPECTOR_51g703 [Gonium pectorale]